MVLFGNLMMVQHCTKSETKLSNSCEYDWDSEETTCTEDKTPCVVDNKSIGDVFPVYFYDGTVEPASNAARFVLNTTK